MKEVAQDWFAWEVPRLGLYVVNVWQRFNRSHTAPLGRGRIRGRVIQTRRPLLTEA